MAGAHTQPQDAQSAGAAGHRPSLSPGLRLIGTRLFAPLALVIMCLIVFLPGQMSVPPLDRDEPRFAQASKQMVESGDYINIHFLEDRRNNKPIGIYWLQSLAVKASGYGAEAPIWVYRSVSVVGATLAVLLTYWVGLAVMSSSASFVAAALMGLTFIVTTEAHLAKTDAFLLASVVLAQGALARLWLARKSEGHSLLLAALFWIGLAVGTLLKGPMGLMISGLTIVSLCLWKREVRWLARLRPLSGFILFLVLVLPWYVAIYRETNGGFFLDSIGRDLLAKVGEGQESHGAPPLTHLLAGIVIFWPLSAFVVLSIPGAWRQRSADCVVFALCWLVPSWIVFEFVSTKLPHYTMPLLPALALMTGYVLVERGSWPKRAILYWSAAGLLIAIPLLIFAASLALPIYLQSWPSPPGVLIAFVGAVLGIMAAVRVKQRAVLNALWPVAGASITLLLAFWAFVAPALGPIWLSPRLVDVIEAGTSCENPSVITVGFNEPSYVFLLTSRVTLGNAESAASFLNTSPVDPCKVATVEKAHVQAFENAAREAGVALKQIGSVSGININGGDEQVIGVYLNGG